MPLIFLELADMLHETVIYLLMIGAFAILVQRASKYDGWLTSALTCFVLLIFYFFLSDWHLGTEHIQTFAFKNAQNDNLKLDILSNKQNYALICPFFINTLLALINNLFLKLEEHKKRFLGLLIFNLISFIMLISGNNLIQLMTFVFTIDIIGCLLVENTNAAKKYSLYNLVSDMGLFLILAMLQGKLVNLDVGNIAHYYETGHHRDFIMFILMLSLFIKFGLFLFQGYWVDLKNAKFHRLYFLPFLSTPMAALILFVKFYPLLVVSPSFLPFLNTILILSMIFGTLGAVFMPSIKEKFAYFNMLQLSFFIKLVEQADFVWRIEFSKLLICFFIFNLCLYAMHNALERSKVQNKRTLICLICSFIFNLTAVSLILLTLNVSSFQVWTWSYLILLFGSVSHMLKSLYAKWKIAEDKENHTDSYSLIFTLAVLGSSFYFCINELAQIEILSVLFSGILIFWFVNPFKYITRSPSFAGYIQNMNFALLYKYFITNPLKHAGFISDIAIDFIFLERTLWPLATRFGTLTVRGYRFISRQGFLYYFLCLTVGIGIILYVLR